MKMNIKIKHPEWLKVSTPGKTIALFNSGTLPKNIAGWMIVTSLKHPLRAVYGSDLRAAWALLWAAIFAATFGRLNIWWQLRHDPNDEIEVE